METITKNVLFFMFLFLVIRLVNSTFFTEPNLLKKFNLSDTKFYESILSPTEFTLRRSFEATFDSVKKGGYSNESDRVDLCCRSLHKCEAHKHIELNYTNEQANIRHCECEYSSKNCLENLNTSSSNVLGFIHNLNTEKCYAIDHPIIKCISFDAPQIGPEIDLHLQNLNTVKRKSVFNRCSKYDLDQGQKMLQLFDVPFNEHATFAFKLISSVRADAVLDNVFTQQKALGEHMKNRIFANKKDLETYFLETINTTFSAGCLLYTAYIDSLENPPHIQMPEATPAANITNAENERSIKLKMIADKAFRNLLKFLRLTMDVACGNLQLLTSNAPKDECPPNWNRNYINHIQNVYTGYFNHG